MKSLKLLIAVSSIVVLFACGGGGGGRASSSSSAQLAATVIDLSAYKNTFADTTLVDGPVVTAGFIFESLLKSLMLHDFFPAAYAQSLTSCNDNVKPVAIDSSTSTSKYKKLPLTAK